MSVIRSFYIVETNSGSGWAALPADATLGDISGAAEGGGSSDNGMATAADSRVGFSLKIRKAALASVPAKLWVRITYKITDAGGTHTARAAVGRVVSVEFSDEDAAWDIACEGVQGILSKTRLFSPLFERKPIARKTTLASPTSASDPACSPLEWLFLAAGGWPAARDFENSAAPFYYDLDQALYNVDATCFAGEDGWAEALELVKSAGGQLYVRSDGVLTYRQPLNFGDTAAVWSYSDTGAPDPIANKALYKNMSYRRSDRKVVTEVRYAGTRRRIYPMQQVLEVNEQRAVFAGQSTTYDLQLDQPLNSIDSQTGTVLIRNNMGPVQLRPEAIIIADGANMPVAQGASGYTHLVQVAALRVTLTITNTSGRPFTVYTIRLTGEPLGAAGTFTASAGVAGGETMNIDENFHVQRQSHAEALCKLNLAFYQAMPNGEARPIYRLTGCLFNPYIDIGSAVLVSSLRYGLTNERCVIINKAHDKSGVLMDLDVVPVSDLPKTSDFYTLGSTNYTGSVKRVAW